MLVVVDDDEEDDIKFTINKIILCKRNEILKTYTLSYVLISFKNFTIFYVLLAFYFNDLKILHLKQPKKLL